jgi:hypothetical protein
MAGRSHLVHMVGYLYEMQDRMNSKMRVAINSNNHLENQNLSSQVISVTRPLTHSPSTKTRSQEETSQPTSRHCVPTHLSTSTNISSSNYISQRYPRQPVTARLPLSDAWSKTYRLRRLSSKPTAGNHSRPLSSTRWRHS